MTGLRAKQGDSLLKREADAATSVDGSLPATPSPREQCDSFGHIWVAVAHGLDRCSRCNAELVDLDQGNVLCWSCGSVIAWKGEEPTDCLKCGEAL